MAKAPQTGVDRPTAPREFAATAPQSPMLDHSYTLQAVMEMHKTVGEQSANIERLISDVRAQGDKIDGLRHQASFIKGGLAASVFFITVTVGIASWVLNAKWEALLQAMKALSK